MPHSLRVRLKNLQRKGELTEKDIDMIFKALEQEPCDDVISRQAVLDITWEEPSYTDALNVLTEVRDKVKALPPVRPQEPKTGEWIALENRFELGDRLKCSECGQVFVVGDDVSRKYCPNCGAEMKGGAE